MMDAEVQSSSPGALMPADDLEQHCPGQHEQVMLKLHECARNCLSRRMQTRRIVYSGIKRYAGKAHVNVPSACMSGPLQQYGSIGMPSKAVTI